MSRRAKLQDVQETVVGSLMRDGRMLVEHATVHMRLECVRATFMADKGLIAEGDELDLSVPGRTIRLTVDRRPSTGRYAWSQVVEARVVFDFRES